MSRHTLEVSQTPRRCGVCVCLQALVPGIAPAQPRPIARMPRRRRFYPQDGWLRVAFVLDNEIREEVHVGQPLSIGISEWNCGGISLDEVSIVRECAMRGAEIIERLERNAVGVRSSPETAPVPRPARRRGRCSASDETTDAKASRLRRGRQPASWLPPPRVYGRRIVGACAMRRSSRAPGIP
jgi:hypothetical protein